MKRTRINLDEEARRVANGHYVNQTMPGVDSSDVSNYLRIRKHVKQLTAAHKENAKARQ